MKLWRPLPELLPFLDVFSCLRLSSLFKGLFPLFFLTVWFFKVHESFSGKTGYRVFHAMSLIHKRFLSSFQVNYDLGCCRRVTMATRSAYQVLICNTVWGSLHGTKYHIVCRFSNIWSCAVSSFVLEQTFLTFDHFSSLSAWETYEVSSYSVLLTPSMPGQEMVETNIVCK